MGPWNRDGSVVNLMETKPRADGAYLDRANGDMAGETLVEASHHPPYDHKALIF